MASQLVLGRVLKPHGVRGELKCACHAEDVEAFVALERVWLARGQAAPRAFAVRKVRMASPAEQVVLLLLEGIADRTQAEAWRDADILVDAADLPPPDDDEVYIEDLLGAAVLLADGTPLGIFEHLLETAEEYDVWAIRSPGGQEILFPAHEDFLVEVDAATQRIVIDPPPGLVDIYLAESSSEPLPKEARHDQSARPDGSGETP
ncbi:ribosome maturation factor RimM [Megalodesulfovibrio gigas]|uniref:Ribosome maturation factor RimM n=1 Tax=Megalodesulfovibrio gigas (strain ATCC 19364 / DSM 1382 / NCIMB 9332 / VKM B-1759) TaxID=1121448 RepID=T2GE17_MEGG1|nr:ribosome maturation factor RimM [Megalodesulfovibrio gigas]AGW14835.1 putative 16S rRNA processing protein RimM [Megalodesulfovibrio gigas DSM 1382 = ATCC 19364]